MRGSVDEAEKPNGDAVTPKQNKTKQERGQEGVELEPFEATKNRGEQGGWAWRSESRVSRRESSRTVAHRTTAGMCGAGGEGGVPMESEAYQLRTKLSQVGQDG